MRKDTLRRFWAMYLLELRLTCLHWSYLIFLVLWSAFIISDYVSDDFAFVGPLFNFVMGFSSLIALFMTGLQATRVSRNRFDALDMALPSGVEVLFARWFASITAVSGLLIAPLFLVVVLPAGRSDVETVARSLGLTFLSTSFATGLIWLCQNTLGIRRWMYPFFAVFWIAGGLVPRDTE